jgi:hypothetical protein
MTGYKSKKAAAQAKTIDEVNWADHEPDGITQPAKEPVDDYCIKYDRPCYKCRNHFCHGDCIDTSPPQRPWVGLTDEDWKEIEDMPDTFDQGVAWCLAKLKGKNT